MTNPPGSLAFECALIGTISQHHASRVPNIGKDMLKTGMFIPHMYGRTEELKALFPGVIISLNTPPQERGVKVLGSILRNSHKDYIKVRLEHMLREAINTYALPLLHLHNLQDRYHIMHRSFMQSFTHLFRTLPPSHTQEFADQVTFVRLFDYCTGGRRTKLPKDPNIVLVEQVHYYRLFLSYKAGGMDLADPHMLRHTAYLGCWTSLLTYEGAERWKRSFPGLPTCARTSSWATARADARVGIPRRSAISIRPATCWQSSGHANTWWRVRRAAKSSPTRTGYSG